MRMLRRCIIFTCLVLAVPPAFAQSAAVTVAVQQPFLRNLSSPVGMAYDSRGNLYIANWSASTVEKIAPNGERGVFTSDVASPSGLAVDGRDNVYVASYSQDAVYRFAPDGKGGLFAGDLATPAGLSFDQSGRLLVANRRTNQILAFTPEGERSVAADGLATPVGAVRKADGSFVISNINGGITIIAPDGRRTEVNGGMERPGPGMALTASGRVFVADYGGTTVKEVLPGGGLRTAVSGLSSPVGLTLAPDGALVIANWGDNAAYRAAIE